MKKIPYLRFVPLIVVALLLTLIIFNWTEATLILNRFVIVFLPFIWGLIFAYLFSPLVNLLERKFKFNRLQSSILTFSIILSTIALTAVIIFPIVINNIVSIVSDIPQHIDNLSTIIRDLISSFEESRLGESILLITGHKDMQAFYEQEVYTQIAIYLESFGVIASNFLTNTAKILFDFTNNTIKVLFGLLISVYIIFDKEKYEYQGKQILVYLFGKEKSISINSTLTESNIIFKNYIIGKSLDSLIIGIITFFTMWIIGSPYQILFALIVGVTNMIPYFGPLIGMIPTTIITLLVDPSKAVWVLIAILLIQQFDGWYLGPKILGDQLGLSAFWVIFAVLVGGGFFNFMGMLLGVPVFAIIRMIFINKLRKNNISLEYNKGRKD